MNFNGIKTIAVVGLSPKPERASYQVAKYLQKAGFRIIPVNPRVDEVFGKKSYPDLSSIPEEIEIDVVNIFRRPEAVPPIVDEAINRGVKIVWMQEGIINKEAAQKAEEHGIQVIMDKCIKKEHAKK